MAWPEQAWINKTLNELAHTAIRHTQDEMQALL